MSTSTDAGAGLADQIDFLLRRVRMVDLSPALDRGTPNSSRR